MSGRLVFAFFTFGALALSPWGDASASDRMPASHRAAAVAADAHRGENGCPSSAVACESHRSHSPDCSAAVGCGGTAVLPSHLQAGIPPTAFTTPRASARVVVPLPRPRPFFRPPKA